MEAAERNWLNRFTAAIRNGHLRYAPDLFKIIAPTQVSIRRDFSAELRLPKNFVAENFEFGYN